MRKYFIIGTRWDSAADDWAEETEKLWLLATNVDDAITEVESYGRDDIKEQTFDIYDRAGRTVAVMVDVGN